MQVMLPNLLGVYLLRPQLLQVAAGNQTLKWLKDMVLAGICKMQLFHSR